MINSKTKLADESTLYQMIYDDIRFQISCSQIFEKYDIIRIGLCESGLSSDLSGLENNIM